MNFIERIVRRLVIELVGSDPDDYNTGLQTLWVCIIMSLCLVVGLVAVIVGWL